MKDVCREIENDLPDLISGSGHATEINGTDVRFVRIRIKNALMGVRFAGHG